MRRDADASMGQTSAKTVEMSVSSQGETNRKLPCISSFVFLKRQRLNLASSSSSEYVKNNSFFEDKDSVDHSTHINNMLLPGLDRYDDLSTLTSVGPQHSGVYGGLCDANTSLEHSPELQDESSREDSAVGEGMESGCDAAVVTSCVHERSGLASVWVTPGDHDCIGVQGNCLEFSTTTTTAHNSTARQLYYDQPLHHLYGHRPQQSPTANVLVVEQSPVETLPVMPGHATRCQPPFPSVPSAGVYPHASPPTPLTHFAVAHTYDFPNTCVDQAGHMAWPEAPNLNDTTFDLGYPGQDNPSVPRVPSCLAHEEVAYCEGRMEASMNFLQASELSPQFGAPGDVQTVSVSGSTNSDLVLDSPWSRVSPMIHAKVTDLEEEIRLMTSSPSLTAKSDFGATDDREEVSLDEEMTGEGLKLKGKKTDLSYIALISKAILSSPEKRMLLSDIYEYLSKNYQDIKGNQRDWRNSVRHNLSLNECFVKQERLGRGRGHYWSIHPACVEDFTKGDFRRRQARRRAKKSSLGADSPSFVVNSFPSDCTGQNGQVDSGTYSPPSQSFQKMPNGQMTIGQNELTYAEMICPNV